MADWLSYGLSDFLLFSPRAYWRLFELHNAGWWPLPLLTLAVGLVAAALAILRPRVAVRPVALLLGILLVWIAWSFFWKAYAAINWAALYVAPGFALQGALMLIPAAGRGLEFTVRGGARPAALALLALAMFYPLLAPLTGHSWSEAEIFGMAPDPTVIGTLGFLLLARGGLRNALLAIPLLWCAASTITLLALDAPQAWMPATAIAATLVAVCRDAAGSRPIRS